MPAAPGPLTFYEVSHVSIFASTDEALAELSERNRREFDPLLELLRREVAVGST